MQLTNKTQGAIWISNRALNPGETLDFGEEVQGNKVVAALLRMGKLTEGATATGRESREESIDIEALVAKLKNSSEKYVRKLCEQYGVEVPEGTELPDIKNLLAKKLMEAGDDDAGDKTDEQGA
jgi:hypothetical protein